MQTIDQMQQILYQNAVDVILYYPDFLSAVRTDKVKNYFYGKPNAQGFYPSQSEFINWRSATPVASALLVVVQRDAVDRHRDHRGGPARRRP